MSLHWQSRLFWIAFLVVYFAAVFSVVGPTRTYSGDELGFIKTSKQFGGGITLDLLTHYEQMSGPLPFVIYGMWGRMFGFDLLPMRIGAATIGLMVYLLLHEFLVGALSNLKAVLLTGIFIAINPYMAAMSVFVYTDMLGVLFLLLACIGIQRS